MRLLLQRVSQARVEVEGQLTGSIERGLLVLIGIAATDTEADADLLLAKTLDLRIFNDGDGKMNLSVRDVGGSLLLVSQFTLYGDTKKGRRPSYDKAAPPAKARELYDYFVAKASESGVPVATGVFQASMQVHLINDGPVTLMLESPPKGEN
jgi:D-aminoacyl-tRNA deacylase